MEMEISQSEIDAMTEGAEKKRMRRELDNRKEIQSLERQKEDMIQAVIQAEKEIFDAQEELKAKENNKYQKRLLILLRWIQERLALSGIPL